MNESNHQVVAGLYYTLPVKKRSGSFLLLSSGTQTIPLPIREAGEFLSPGDEVDVFVYNAGRDGLMATTRTPYAVLGDIVGLRVKTITDRGLFLDWGIGKDLFVPTKSPERELQEGDMAIIQIIPDYDGVGAIGTFKYHSNLESDPFDLKENQEVSCLVTGQSELGYRVIIDQKFKGLLYYNEVFEELNVGDLKKGFIKKIREDGLIDAALQKQHFREASSDARSLILDALNEAGGFLPLHDRSTPKEIGDSLKISKKLFKKVVGGLYRDQIITIENDGIRLKKA